MHPGAIVDIGSTPRGAAASTTRATARARRGWARLGLLAVALAAWASSEAPAHARPRDLGREAARRHYARALSFYGEARFAEALREFTAVGLLRPLPAVDYNIALCDEKLGLIADAIAAFERFAAATPDADAAREARERIAGLRELAARQGTPVAPALPSSTPPMASPPPAIAAQAPAAAIEAPSPPPPVAAEAPAPVAAEAPAPVAAALPSAAAAAPAATEPAPVHVDAAAVLAAPAGDVPRARRSLFAGVVLGVVGGAAVLAGVGLDAAAVMRHDDLQRQCGNACAPSSWADARTQQEAGVALLIAGGALLAADVVVLAVRAVDARAVAPRLALRPLGAGLALGGTF